LGRADDAQAQLRRLDRPARITEDTEYHLSDRLGALGGKISGVGRLGEGARREYAQQRHQQHASPAQTALCGRDSHVHAAILSGVF